MTSCCCELSKLRNAGANRDRTSLPRGVRTALSPKQGGKVGEKAQPCPLNRRTFLTPPLCVCYTLDKLLKCTPALQHVCCRPPCEGVGRNRDFWEREVWDKDVALHARAWVEIPSHYKTSKNRMIKPFSVLYWFLKNRCPKQIAYISLHNSTFVTSQLAYDLAYDLPSRLMVSTDEAPDQICVIRSKLQ